MNASQAVQHSVHMAIGHMSIQTKAGYTTYLLCSIYNTLGHDVTLHDASKDIDQQGLHLFVRRQELESLNHLNLTPESVMTNSGS